MPEVQDLPDLDEALATLSRCVTLFMAARISENIYFDDDLVREGTRFVGQLLQASAKNPETMPAYFKHVSDHGLERCQALIDTVSLRPNRTLTVSDVHTLASTFEPYGPSFLRNTEDITAGSPALETESS